MAALSLQLIGDLKVLRDGQEQNLPPSKKTRALLAYLALNPQQFRREHLCELLWEVPDDPRGSLRWSLSKIRRLVDDDGHPRIIADRSHVALNPDDVQIDSKDLRSLVSEKISETSTRELILAARKYQGQFLDGLDLANFNDFSTWCVTEREQVNRDQTALLMEVVERLQDRPEESLEFARRLVALNPYDKTSRVRLIELMLACGRDREAEQQVEQGTRLLKEVGDDVAVLHQAWRNRKLSARQASPTPVSIPSTATNAGLSVEDCGRRLIGRDRELAALESSFNQVLSASKAHCFLIKGEPGIGKSSLLQCAYDLARQSGASILRAGAFESEVVRPFGLWSDALRESSNSATLELLNGSERIDRDRLFTSISQLVSRQAQTSPVVILFDDMQWSDESSGAALHYVLRMNARAPLWVVLGARDEELKSNPSMLSVLRDLRRDGILSREVLKPLSEGDVLKLIAARIPDADSAVISRKSRGNPLLAIELARGVASGDVVGTLNELINERLARMSETTVSLLQWAAVMAPNISIGALLRYTRLDDESLEQALEEAESKGFLFPTEAGFKFSHELVARCIYQAISHSRRSSMHRRIAELLEADTALDLQLASELARHASQGGDSRLAARSLLQAARLCLRFYANDDAFELARRGLECVSALSEPERISLTLELKEVQLMAAPLEDWETAAAEFITLAESALDHGAQESARLGYHMASTIRWTHGQWSGARKTILQAERVTRGGTEEVRIRGIAEAARCLLLLEKDLPEADAMLMEAASRSKRREVESDALPAARGMLRYYENKLDEAEELLDEARTRAKAQGDRINEYQANEYLAMIEIERGDFQAARSRCQPLLDIGEKLRRGSEAPFARALDAVCSLALDQDDSGFAESVERLRVVDAKQRLIYVLNRAALLYLQMQNRDAAIACAAEALENARIMDRPSEIIYALVVLAQAHLARADQENYKQHLQALLAMPDTIGAQWARDRASRFIADNKEQCHV